MPDRARTPAGSTRRSAWGLELHAGYGLVTLAYMAAIFVLSSIPDRGIANSPYNPVTGRVSTGALEVFLDVLHVFMYAGLAFLFLNAATGGQAHRTLPWGPYAIALLAIAAYGVFDEWHQSFVPGRGPSVTDVVMDLVGGIAMLALLRLRAAPEARA